MLFLQLVELGFGGLPLFLCDLVLVDWGGGLEIVGFGLFAGVVLAVLLTKHLLQLQIVCVLFFFKLLPLLCLFPCYF